MFFLHQTFIRRRFIMSWKKTAVQIGFLAADYGVKRYKKKKKVKQKAKNVKQSAKKVKKTTKKGRK
jgi:hypothetical protein